MRSPIAAMPPAGGRTLYEAGGDLDQDYLPAERRRAEALTRRAQRPLDGERRGEQLLFLVAAADELHADRHPFRIEPDRNVDGAHVPDVEHPDIAADLQGPLAEHLHVLDVGELG